MEFYVLDENLNQVGIVDAFNSAIWARRYQELGDCELYLTASAENIDLLQQGYYLMRLDDDMVCRINRIELTTDAENGNYMTVSGTDAKSILDQRIIWGTATCNGSVEQFIRNRISNALISPANTARKIDLIELGEAAGFTQTAEFQVSYSNLGEKIREYCKNYGWGYKFILNGTKLDFILYAGADRSDEVIFSDNYENLSSSEYSDSREDMSNVALIGGQGEGSARIKATLGTQEGVERYEVFVDADDLSTGIRYDELVATYPNGTVITSGSGGAYRLATLDTAIIDAAHLEWLQDNYTGTVVTISGVQYYRTTNTIIADLESTTPQASDEAVLREIVYHSYLLNRGAEKIAGSGERESFNGSIIPEITFTYKEDYDLGDIVYIENEYGIGASARIIEIIEAQDENGTHIEPTFEYIS